MKTHNLNIYHCLACGAVMHCEPGEGVPECCGRPMIMAAAETVSGGERDDSPGASPRPGEPPPTDRVGKDWR